MRALAVMSLGLTLVGGSVPRAVADGAARPATPERLAQGATPAPLPPTKTVTVMVEGEPQPMVMQLYQHPEVPLVTYYPAAMTVSQACDADGCGVSFTDDATSTGVIVMFPAAATTAAAVAPLITGPEGLMAGNGWVVTGAYTDALEFPWARQMITFRTPELTAVGVAYLGEASGQGFAAVVVLPPDAGDGFMPQANAMLAELRVRPLP